MLTNTAFVRLCRARDRLRETGDRRRSIEEIAREAAMSPFQFIRRFHSLFGETPHQYRIRARLERAKRLLAASNASVTDVCLDVGFTSLGTFSDLFARRVGIAPSRYRRTVRRAAEAPSGCLNLMGAAFAISEKHESATHDRVSSHADQADQHHGR